MRRAKLKAVRGIAVTDDDIFGPGYDGIATPAGLVIVDDAPAAPSDWCYSTSSATRSMTQLTKRRPRSKTLCAGTSQSSRPASRKGFSYFSSPAEAFAEFFAERYDPILVRGRRGHRPPGAHTPRGQR
jgi:hypothetical protein